MGIKVYYYLVAAVLIFGLIMPQQGPKRKNYIILMAALHAFVCGWRYQFLTGDLMKYCNTFNHIVSYGFFSKEVFNEGKNFGFYFFLRLVHLFSHDFQLVLIIIAIVTEILLAVLIFRYSPRPWLSYLMWNCVGLYIFGFSAIKQALAMGLLLPACDGIMKNNRAKFLFWTLLAGAVHVPALILLPAYWITHYERKLSWLVFAISAVLVLIFRAEVVSFISQFYYSDDALEEIGLLNNDSGLGGRFFMMIILLALGYFVKGLSGDSFRKVFKLMAAATVLQSFSGFDNIFTRLADYYFQFVVLYAPMVFFDFEKHGSDKQVLHLDRDAKMLAMVATICFSLWFYSYGCLNYTSTVTVDDYTNYRFSWEVENAEQPSGVVADPDY